MVALRKLYYRFFKPRSYWHNRKYDPSFKMEIGANGHASFSLKGRHICTTRPISELKATSKTACIIASGPSVKKITDISQFHTQSCACVNGSYVLAEKLGFMPDYYIVSDAKFINEYGKHELFMRAIKGSKRFITQHQLIHRAAQMGLDLTQANEIYLYDDLLKPFMQVKKPLAFYRRDTEHFLIHRTHNMGYSMSPALGIFSSGTVVFNATQILFGCGVDSIYIFGMDLSNQKRFYESSLEYPSDHEATFAWRTLPSFELVSEYVRTHNKEIWNCSPESRLPAEILPKMDPNEAMNKLAQTTSDSKAVPS